MKMYKKSDLTIVDGMLVASDGEIVLPDVRIVEQANELETLKQETEFLAAQPSATPMPTLDGFKRQSINDAKMEFFTSTPTIDMKVMEAMEIMSELDDVSMVTHANELAEHYAQLIAFVDADYVVDCGQQIVTLFDTPTLGSVLELTKEDVVSVIAMACGMKEEGITIHTDEDEEADEE